MQIVLSHVASDFDALGATIAAAKVYPQAVPVLQDTLGPGVREFVALHKEALGLRHLDEIDAGAVTRVIVVDTQSPGRLGKLAPALDRDDVEWVVYDHHPHADGDLPPAPGRREAMGATTTMLVEELARRGQHVTPLEATAMALGIYADTGNLLFANTRAADARAVAWLLEQGARLEVVADYVERALDPSLDVLLHRLIEAALPENRQGVSTLVVGAEVPEYLEGVASVAHRLIALMNVDVLVMAIAMGPRTQFVARSRLPEVDVRPLLADYAVRGHAQAASAHAKGLDWRSALARIQEALPSVLPAEPTAADLMSAPVRTVAPDARAEDVRAMLLHQGHGAFVVVDGGRPCGVISRRDLDRTVHHGLGDALVADLMTRRLVTVTPDTGLSDIEAVFVAHDIGRVPVLRGAALVGIVTRSDLLRVRYSGDGAGHAVAAQVSEVSRRLRSLWPAEWLSLIDRVGVVAGEEPVYLVGGAVRDLLLGRANLDVDLVVEGDAIALARRVQAAISDDDPLTELRVHLPFGTAQLILSDGRKVDFATARTEHYAHPGALPTVAFSSIKHDLARRDFSVNALALRLDPAHFGELLDFFRSRQDLAQQQLRVLHNLSFIEDPTRLLRAVRFEHQLGFRLDPQSEAYAVFAMGTGRFDGIGGERNKQELRRILSEPDPVPLVRRLAELDGWRLLSPDLQVDDAALRRLVRVRRLLRKAGDVVGGAAWIVMLASLLGPLGVDAAATVAARLGLNGHDTRLLVDAVAHARVLMEEGELLSLSPLALVDRLAALPGAGLVYLATQARTRAQRQRLLQYLREWRHLRLSVDGADLKALGLPPGPAYGQILREVLDRRLAGEVATAADERALLETLAARAREE